MDRSDLIAALTPKVDAFMGMFDMFEPWQPPEVVDGRAVIDIRGVIGFDVDADDIAPKLRGLNADTLEVHIDSSGGNVWHGVALANALMQHPARVEVEVDAVAASAGSIIAMAGDSVTMHPGSMMMVHNGRGYVDGGTAEQMRAVAGLLDQINMNMADTYTARAGGTREQWLEVMAAETWFTGDEAVAAGLATSTVTVEQRSSSDSSGGGEEAETDLREVFGYRYNGRADAPAPDFVIASLTDPAVKPDGVIATYWTEAEAELLDAVKPVPADPETDRGAELWTEYVDDQVAAFAAAFTTKDIPSAADWAEAILGKASHANSN